ncbi:hypothetical protein V5O48_011769 [Marasmius crinis-equi]|uniref:Uncharacterized protein n=1 Tax=Marasmius crinis-equi TaxID=585013 RepID=A0ABR3F4Q4_9AGAR
MSHSHSLPTNDATSDGWIIRDKGSVGGKSVRFLPYSNALHSSRENRTKLLSQSPLWSPVIEEGQASQTSPELESNSSSSSSPSDQHVRERVPKVTCKPEKDDNSESRPRDDSGSDLNATSVSRGSMDPTGPEIADPSFCISDTLYRDLTKDTEAFILAGLDMDVAHLRYSELKEQQKAIEWELRKMERQWVSLVDTHSASDARLVDTRQRVFLEAGRHGGHLLTQGVYRQRYVSFVGLPQYALVKMRLQQMGYVV